MEITAKHITMIVIQVLRCDLTREKKLFAIIGIIKVSISYTFK